MPYSCSQKGRARLREKILIFSSLQLLCKSFSRISVVAMNGATISIDDASATDTIRSVKQRVFNKDSSLQVFRQLLVYQPGPHGIDALPDDETLCGAGVAQDGTAKLDMMLRDVTYVPPRMVP